MKNELTTFPFQAEGVDQSVRVVQIAGAPWFVAADVCRALGFVSPATVNTRKLASDQKGLSPICTPGGMQSLSVISESGLYKLVMRADGAHAIPFQDWVTRVVLPAIRKDGGYVAGEEKVATGEMSEDELILRVMRMQEAKVARLVTERDKLQAVNLSPLR
jgi:prophage antirepressor-like protein